MSNSTQFQNNITLSQSNLRALNVFLSLSPCLLFLYINGVMLFTLRSKPVFRETSRYLLLYNLLVAETLQLALSQFLYILAVAGIYLIRYVCVIIAMFVILVTNISPFNLAVMSLERYVAVCFPLRHAQIVTIKSTGVAIAVLWTLSTIITVIWFTIYILLEPIPLDHTMRGICAKENIFRLKILDDYDKAFTGITFISVCILIIFSYFGVMIAAKSASTDKTSFSKAHKTVLLHLIQLLLSLSTTLVSPILSAVHGKVDKVTLHRIHYALFLCVVNLPRCLSSPIYGLGDQTIRPMLIYHLRFGLRCTGMRSGTSDKQ